MPPLCIVRLSFLHDEEILGWIKYPIQARSPFKELGDVCKAEERKLVLCRPDDYEFSPGPKGEMRRQANEYTVSKYLSDVNDRNRPTFRQQSLHYCKDGSKRKNQCGKQLHAPKNVSRAPYTMVPTTTLLYAITERTRGLLSA
ncbi:MAG: hypothetical protein Q9214_002871 [Letrouitia sp. 1 TL-2023]